MTPAVLSDQDRELAEKCRQEWLPSRRVGRHSLHTHELSEEAKNHLAALAADCGMKVGFFEEELCGKRVRYLVAERIQWWGPRPGQK